MKMFKISNKLTAVFLSIAAVMVLNSCNVEPEDRFTPVDKPIVARNTLLMDFTGQRCVNCPAAHEMLESLIEQYEGRLIGVSIHGGAMAMSTDRTDFSKNQIGLMIKEGNEINQAFGIETWPMGVVDRINDPNAAINDAQWGTAVANAIGIPAKANIEAEASIVGENIEVKTTVSSDLVTKAALQVWVIEDGIVAVQSTPQGAKKDYVHNNVLRYVQYPVKAGQPLTLTAGEKVEDSCTIPVKYDDKERWNKDNLSIVAFVFEGKEILQTVRVKVTNE